MADFTLLSEIRCVVEVCHRFGEGSLAFRLARAGALILVVHAEVGRIFSRLSNFFLAHVVVVETLTCSVDLRLTTNSLLDRVVAGHEGRESDREKDSGGRGGGAV